MGLRLEPHQYLFRTAREVSVGGLALNLSVCPPLEEHPRHTHVNPGITISLGGGYREIFDDAEVDLSFLATRWRSAEVSHSHTVGTRGASALHLEFDNAWLRDHQVSHGALKDWAVKDDAHSRTLALRITLAAASGQSTELIQDWVIDLLSQISDQRETPDRCPTWLLRARDFIVDNIESGASLRTVASEVGISPMHLAATFRAHFGESISMYQRRLRLLEAAAQVEEGAATLGRAAITAGFYDQAHFCRTFRDQFAAQPKTLATLQRSLNRAFVQAFEPSKIEEF
jgi:AraC family transcriptional regulator